MRILMYLIWYTALSQAIAGVLYAVSPLSTANPNQNDIFEQKANAAPTQTAAALRSIVIFIFSQPVPLAGLNKTVHIRRKLAPDLV